MREIPINLDKTELSKFSNGKGYHIYKELGAHPGKINGKLGTRFAVYAPKAKGVSVIGDFNRWDDSADSMEPVPGTDECVWKKVVEGCGENRRYLFKITTAKGETRIKVDPFGFSFKTTDPHVPSNGNETEENAAIDPDVMGTAAIDPEVMRKAMRNASIICSFRGEFHWEDDKWLTKRKHIDNDPLKKRMSIYELHLGSWQRDPTGEDPGNYLNYENIAEKLVEYVRKMGFTHVEFLPVAEHPYYPSWGYQVSGFFTPTSRYGTPDNFRFLVNALHKAEIGVIIDWVPGHFAKDEWGLKCFDGKPLYEDKEDERSEHPEWGTLEFNHESPEVRSFLISNALYWCEEFHVDGLRVDAVASMLYLDYARKPGEWKPKPIPEEFKDSEYYTDNIDPDAVKFFKKLNEVVHSKHPGVVTIAEESTAWPGVTPANPPDKKLALDFDFKWDMGWMNNNLAYFQQEPREQEPKEQWLKEQWLKERQEWHDEKLTFAMHYFNNENYLRPLSHDEVVHEKRSLLEKMPGDEKSEQFANLRVLLGYQWCLPGKQLLFMGGEIGQHTEWDHGGKIDLKWDEIDLELDEIDSEWDEIDLELFHVIKKRELKRKLKWKFTNVDGLPGGLQRWVKDLNELYCGKPALYKADYNLHDFEWIEREYSEAKVISFVRWSSDAEQVLVVFNLSTEERPNHRVGPLGVGGWRVELNSDNKEYGGDNSRVNCKEMSEEKGQFFIELRLPPSTCLIFKRG